MLFFFFFLSSTTQWWQLTNQYWQTTDQRRMNMKLCKRKVEGLLRKYNRRKHNKGATQLLQELEEKYERHFNRIDLWHGVWRVYFPNTAWQLKLISSLNSCRHFLESANLNECQLVGISIEAWVHFKCERERGEHGENRKLLQDFQWQQLQSSGVSLITNGHISSLREEQSGAPKAFPPPEWIWEGFD